MNTKKITISRNQESEYDTFRKVCLLFGEPKIDPHTDRDKLDYQLSTDQIISIFDMGYQLGIVQNKQILNDNLIKFHQECLSEFNYTHNDISKFLIDDESHKDPSSIFDSLNKFETYLNSSTELLIDSFNLQMETCIETSKVNNKNVIIDEEIKKNNIDTFEDIQNGWFNFHTKEPVKPEKTSSNNPMIFNLKDSNDSTINIHISGFSLPSISHNPLNIDCVTLSPRYDHGFGFSKLYRVVNDKDSLLIKNLVDESNLTNQVILLPKDVSDTWRVILTPTVKSNSEIGKEFSKKLMLDLFSLSQSEEVKSKRLLITHFGFLLSYPDKTFDGILEGLLEISRKSFLNITDIYIEFDTKYISKFEKQVMEKFNK